MVVAGLTVDPVNNTPIVILREKGGARVLPIWIGVIEASAIAFELEKVQLNRPMTHDLMKMAVEALGATVSEVRVVDLKENTYYAVVLLERDGKQIELDARPSDAMAIALRSKARVYCSEDVLALAQERQLLRQQENPQGQSEEQGSGASNTEAAPPASPDSPAAVQQSANSDTDSADSEGSDSDASERGESGPKPLMDAGKRSWKDILENLDPEDFGKYKM